MKKTIGKPENWQDFESLCKRLWGEIWGIPNKIKKNGRLGQNQAGVDVYGVPKGETNYWGIQAKGKDDYSNAKLTENEIINEVEKAKSFQPALAVYIFASTTNKDSKIEEFVRLLDIDNQRQGSFEILLFCWEDIVDLLEDNRDTYQWYMHGIGQKDKFDFKILFNNCQEELILEPILEKKITRYKLTDKTDTELIFQNMSSFSSSLIINTSPIDILNPFRQTRINKSWCTFEIVMENSGSAVIEDWHLYIQFISGVCRLDDGSPFLPKFSHTTFIDDKNKTISYHPHNNNPLIQKDNKHFEVSLLPEPDASKIVFEWELLARDFNRKETKEILISPKFIEEIEFREVNKIDEIKEDEIFISFNVVDTEVKKK